MTGSNTRTAHDRKPLLRPADLRKAVAEWAGKGFTVQIAPDGSMTVSPPQSAAPTDPFDLVDFAR